jgi:hypothetical protein
MSFFDYRSSPTDHLVVVAFEDDPATTIVIYDVGLGYFFNFKL